MCAGPDLPRDNQSQLQYPNPSLPSLRKLAIDQAKRTAISKRQKRQAKRMIFKDLLELADSLIGIRQRTKGGLGVGDQKVVTLSFPLLVMKSTHIHGPHVRQEQL